MRHFGSTITVQKCKNLRQLQIVHAQFIVRSINHQPLSCKILALYSKFSKPYDALNVFHQIQNPDLITLTSLLNLYLQLKQPKKAILVFKNLHNIDAFSVVGALSASGAIRNLPLGKSIHGSILKHGFESDNVVNNALVDMYCRNDEIDSATVVFTQMKVKDSVSYSSILNGHLICNGLEFACQVFDKMPEKDVVSWTVMITGHVQRKRPLKALELFCAMRLEGHHPTLVTVVSVLSACSDIGAYDLGRVIHGSIVKMNDRSDGLVVGNSLLDMYSKSGHIYIACKIFEEMVDKDVYTWTTMISGFAVHGDGKNAIKILYRMLESRVEPNEVTFVNILLACCHSGMVNEGRYWFTKMKEGYKLKPRIEHYGCMVDLLGRAGLLKQAIGLIREMEGKPDCVIWRSLLSASLAHGNVEMAELAGNEIIKEEPDDDGVYVLLWNMYASLNRWEEALGMRNKMKNRNISKRPGCSWIELDGHVHEFLVADKTHKFNEEIYSILEGMAKQMRMQVVDLFEYAYIMEMYPEQKLKGQII